MSDPDLNPQPTPPQSGAGEAQAPGYAAAPQQPGYGTPQQPGYGAPGYGAPGYGAPGYGAPSRPGYNTLAIVGFILAFFVNIVGIILGFVALSQIKRTGEQGRGLAIAAIVIGFAEILLGILLAIVFSVVFGAAMSHYRTY